MGSTIQGHNLYLPAQTAAKEGEKSKNRNPHMGIPVFDFNAGGRT